MWCITVKGLEIFASGADDIINDKSGFCSMSAVANASLYNVYYLWFGPRVRLHLGMVRNSFLELSIKDLHVKTDQNLTGINNHIYGFPSCGLSLVIFVCLDIRNSTSREKKSLRQIIIWTGTLTRHVNQEKCN